VIKLTTVDGLLVSFDHPRFVGIPHETKEALALWVVHALRPGSCTVALLEHGSPRLTAFRERVDAMRSARQMTVEDRSKLLAVVWSDLQPLAVN
jgi:hypothetical protein